MKRFDVRDIDLGVLDSLTQYPSIPTYHKLDPNNGQLTEEPVEFTGEVIATEKVDGTNARLITLPGDMYIIGSRTELLYAKGDLIGNPTLGIVKTLRPVADEIFLTADAIMVYYLEVYGGTVGKYASQYTGSKTSGYRMFDAQVIDVARLEMTAPSAAAWRDHGRQTWLDEVDVAKVAQLIDVELVPRLFTVDASDLPTTVDTMSAFLGERLPRTRVALDEGAGGKAEGIVLRSVDRTAIAKARFQDYERTLRKRRGK